MADSVLVPRPGPKSRPIGRPNEKKPGFLMVSACLLGRPCRYDGQSKKHPLISRLDPAVILPVCPEQMGGLPTPRPPAEICGGSARDVLEGKARVINREGTDVTREYYKGAVETLDLARKWGIRYAVLKEKSPSCAPSCVYDGNFQDRVRPGLGLAAYLLQKNGITLISDEEVSETLLRSIMLELQS